MTQDGDFGGEARAPGRSRVDVGEAASAHTSAPAPFAFERGASAGNSPAAGPAPPGKAWARRAALVACAAGVLAAGVTFLLAPGKDAVSASEQQQRIEEFARAGTLLTERVPATEVGPALAAMALPAADKQRLHSQLDGGSARLVYITLWDNVAEDDDRVRIDSGSYSIEVALKHRQVRIAVPEPPSGTLNVVGTRDGGGGITVAMLSGQATVRLPVMATGQTLGVPVASAP